MKKLTALFLTLVVALSLSVTALAANSSDNDAIIQQAIDLLIEGKSGEAENLILNQVSNLVIQDKRDEAQALMDGYRAAKAAAADEIAAAAAVREAEAEAARKAKEEADREAARQAAIDSLPEFTQEGSTVTMTTASGFEVVISDVISYEDIICEYSYGHFDAYRIFHITEDADEVIFKNAGHNDEFDSVHAWLVTGPPYDDNEQWSYTTDGDGVLNIRSAGDYVTFTPSVIFSEEGGRPRTVNENILLADCCYWGGPTVFLAADNGRTSFTDRTIDGIPFVDYFAQETAPADTTAYANTQTVSIDGKAVTLEAYALKDANGNPTNYVKLRDVAYALNGTAAQFEVAWDGNVNIVTGKSYTANGSEMSTPFSGDRSYSVPTAVTKINGVAADLAAISLTDDSGGGYTYYQLRDLGRALGFNVGWSAERGIFIETDKPYTDAD